ncbi:F0F1 ATP synthase subunit B [Ponticaulis sp.]|uniref:F0F1 ATP synthase subunit B n=1 Tax=Ponticaulis sp. TaxID=2020902 RepID=UPI000B6A3380|nr:F0F1 ATP synthase subunit B [Ponticaulis sp.]MAJ08778.1 F0F1 ATP synthase subunit B' [Ponticaulis sp.]RPG17475.1 MAG: F0F1 ATP synthase subunit B [Hyphomonadaceae bacterium TMED125]HBJ93936.1 F0F1 ATP synthase subunit B' [Hyphomonadaceae bacterium]
MANDTHGADHAVETLAEHGAEHAGPAFPPFDTSTFASQLFWLAIAFVLLYLFLSRLILPKLGGVIEQRKGKIASDLDEAARMKSEADEALMEADKQLATARAEARMNAEKARSEIDAKIAEASAAKTAELDAKLSEAETRIDDMKAKAMDNVASIAARTTGAILSQLGTTASEADIAASVAKSLDEVAA